MALSYISSEESGKSLAKNHTFYENFLYAERNRWTPLSMEDRFTFIQPVHYYKSYKQDR